MAATPKPLLLLSSLALPVAATVVLSLAFVSVMSLSRTNRAVVWIHGDPITLAASAEAVRSSPHCPEGRVRVATDAGNTAPPDCPSDARELSFGRLGDHELNAANDLLVRVARSNGAAVCQSHAFVFNDTLGQPASQRPLESLVAIGVGTGVPIAFAGLAYFGLLAPPRPSPAPVRARAWLTGIGTGVSLGLLLLLGACTRQGPPAMDAVAANLGVLAQLPLEVTLALLVAAPVVEEIAFRGWLITLAEKAVGTRAAVVLSVLACTAAQQPDTVVVAALAAGLGTALGLLFVRGRSLVANIAAHGLAAFAAAASGLLW